MQKKLIKEYNELIDELVLVSFDESWKDIIEFTDENYDSAIIVLKVKLKEKIFSYIDYNENEEEEENFYNNAYNAACSISEQNKFLWFMRSRIIFFDFIKFSLIDKLKIKRS